MEVKVGEKINLKVEEQSVGSLYKWVVKKDKDLVNAQTGTVFTYQFDQLGEYQVNLTTTNAQEIIRTTSIVVKVGEKFSRTPHPEAPLAGRKLPSERLDEHLVPVTRNALEQFRRQGPRGAFNNLHIGLQQRLTSRHCIVSPRFAVLPTAGGHL